MNSLETISKKDLRELLCMNWMTHDGMWFFHVLQECGGKVASDLNKAAVRAMCSFEVHRLKKILGVEEVKTYDELKDFIESAFSLIGADFMQFNRQYPGNNTLRWDVDDGQCFAYKGIKRMGALDHYDCGIFYRIETWLRELGLSFQASPEVSGCLMHQGKPCYREIIVDL